MKDMRKLLIAILLTGLILGASPLGSCYSNSIAQKTTNEASEYASMTQIGLSPGAQISLAGTAILGSGIVAGVGTLSVATGMTAATASASTATAMAPMEIEMLEVPGIVWEGWFIPDSLWFDGAYFEGALLDGAITEGAGAAGASFASVLAPYLIPVGIALCVVVVVLLVTAAGVFVVWSYT